MPSGGILGWKDVGPRVLLEGVVIVASILLAFGLQAWWEGRQEVREELSYLQSLRSDFRQSRDRALEHISENQLSLESGVRLLSLLTEPAGTVDSDTISAALERALWIWTFEPVLGTYRDMVNSGDLRLIQSDELRIALSQFEEKVETGDRLDQTLWEHWLGFELPFLKDHAVLSRVYEGYRGSADQRGAEVPPLSFGENPFEADQSALRSQAFHNILVARTVAHQDAIVNMKSALVQIESVLALVGAELARLD